MKITVLSLFPEMLRGFFESSIMARAVKKGLIEYELVDIRDYAQDRHHKCDDEVFGGGAGMLMLADPLFRCLEARGAREKRTVFVTPSGRLFNQAYARDLAREGELVILCGHYEGVDQRVIEEFVDDEVSIGDYVLSSGEVAALVLVDAVFPLDSRGDHGREPRGREFRERRGGAWPPGVSPVYTPIALWYNESP